MAAPVDIQSPTETDVFRRTEVTSESNVTPQFDASRHLVYTPPSGILKMKDLGLSPTALSDVSSTEPFPLLSAEAVLQHRRELFSKEVVDNCSHNTRPGTVQLRGMAPRYAPFIHQFWTSPEVLKIVSENAGIELVPALDYEICHTNVQLGPDGKEGVRHTPVVPPLATVDAIKEFEEAAASYEKSATQANESKTPVVPWHRDSHPFVCVVMLSDARYMVGGETEMKGGDGKTLKVKAPQMGCAAILQGRYISHIARPAANMPERITIVTSFRPKNPLLLDETTNVNTWDKSLLPELHYQWTTYRLDVLATRAKLARDELKQRYEENIAKFDAVRKPGYCTVETVNVAEVESWTEQQIVYMQRTLQEMKYSGEFRLFNG